MGNQKFALKTNERFGVNGMDNLQTHWLKATLVCFIFNNKLFVFCNLAQSINFIGTDSSWERARIFRSHERSGNSQESGVSDC